jgi:hypothetical protein
MKRYSLLAGLVLACGSLQSAPQLPELPSPGGLGSDGHLLLNPTGDGEQLLGRAVTKGPNGEFVLAEELAPGCHVTVHEAPAAWHRDFEEDLGDLAVGSASLPVLGGLRAKYGRQIRAKAAIDNVKELVADVSGPCGDVIVKSVKVGTGSRELQYRLESEAGLDAKIGEAGLTAHSQSWRRIGETLSWKQEQAWAFTAGSVPGAESIRLAIEMPEQLTDGQEYTLQVTAARQVWVVALFEEAEGRAGVLLPNSENPYVVVPQGERQPLPTMRVSLREPRVAAREKIVLYGFVEKEDYLDFRPPAGAISEAESTSYFKGLEGRLSALPRRRWGRAEVAYLIKPK